ncbi:phytoene/squalene synthase family protein [Candidatus Endowatersipora endosymbiont of Watersipora subatra]|uniref:phytoene/squalene synthase family protein n=1 Tax=Candidatus Endowatersipora endosymbiont of Watersipora subatra TaxID=3077946 RepID=UPI00312C76CD
MEHYERADDYYYRSIISQEKDLKNHLFNIMMNSGYLREDLKYCRQLLRLYMNDEYLANLLLSQSIQDNIVVLHAFHAGLMEAVNQIIEPMAGEIRLQWWSDVLNGKRNEEAAGHPLARSLLYLIKQQPVAVDQETIKTMLNTKIKAHVVEVHRQSMKSLSMLENWFVETHSSLFQLSAMMNGSKVNSELLNASRHSGIAQGLMRILINLARYRSMKRIFVPLDILNEYDLNTEDFLQSIDQRHEKLIIALIQLTTDHYKKALIEIRNLDRSSRKIFCILSLIPLYLRIFQESPRETLTGIQKFPLQFCRQWVLLLSFISW